MKKPKQKKRKYNKSLKEVVKIYGLGMFIVLAVLIAAYQFVEPAPPNTLTIATASEEGAYYSFAQKYKVHFSKEKIELKVLQTTGSVENLQLLKDVPFFASFPTKAIKLLAFLAEKDLFQPGDILFEKGYDNAKAYLVLSGKLQLLKKSATGNIIAQEFRAGDFLGLFSLLGSMPALFALQAEEKTTVLTISRTQFDKIQEQFPETGKIALKAILKELHLWESQRISEAKECCLKMTGVTAL